MHSSHNNVYTLRTPLAVSGTIAPFRYCCMSSVGTPVPCIVREVCPFIISNGRPVETLRHPLVVPTNTISKLPTSFSKLENVLLSTFPKQSASKRLADKKRNQAKIGCALCLLEPLLCPVLALSVNPLFHVLALSLSERSLSPVRTFSLNPVSFRSSCSFLTLSLTLLRSLCQRSLRPVFAPLASLSLSSPHSLCQPTL